MLVGIATVLSPAIARADGDFRALVTDAQGKPIAGATLVISGPRSLRLTADAAGLVDAPALPDGRYAADVSAPGFQPQHVDAIVVPPAGSAPAAIVLSTADITKLRTIGRSAVTGGGRTALNDSPAAVNVISGNDFIERATPQVNTLLDETPGVEVQHFSSGEPGAISTVSIRGAADFETQNLIDGHPVSSGAFGDYVTTFLNGLVLGDVEVVKGPGTSLNTINGAIGGTVNFRTPDFTTKPVGVAVAGYNSHNGDYTGFRFSDSFGKIGVVAAYAGYGTPGYVQNQNALLIGSSAGSLAPGANETIVASRPLTTSYVNRSEVLKLRYGFSPATSVGIGYFGAQTQTSQEANLANADLVNVVASANPQMNATASYTNPAFAGLVGKQVLAYTYFPTDTEFNNEPIFTADARTAIGRTNLTVRGYAGSISRQIDGTGEAGTLADCGDPACSAANASFGSPFVQTEIDFLHGIDAQYDIPLGQQNVVTLSYDQHSDNTTKGSGSPDSIFFGTPGVTVLQRTYSVRGDFRLSDRLRLEEANYFSKSNYSSPHLDPHIGLTYRIDPNAIVRASYGSSYVVPYGGTIVPTAFVDRPGPKGTLNPATFLAPETSSGYDFGGDFRVAGTGKISLDLYDTRIFNKFENTSVTLPVPATFQGQQYNQISTNFNASGSREAGVEVAFDDTPRVGFGVDAYVDLLRSYNYAQYPGVSFTPDGEQIKSDPYSKSRAQLSYRFANTLQARAGVTNYGANNAFGESGFALFDAGIDVPLGSGVMLDFTGNNLFNHDNYRGTTLAQAGYGVIQSDLTSQAQDLFFAPPRELTLQLVYPFGGRR